MAQATAAPGAGRPLVPDPLGAVGPARADAAFDLALEAFLAHCRGTLEGPEAA